MGRLSPYFFPSKPPTPSFVTVDRHAMIFTTLLTFLLGGSAILAAPIPKVQNDYTLGQWADYNSQAAGSLAGAAGNSIKGAAQSVGNGITGAASAVGGGFKDATHTIGGSIQNAATNIATGVKYATQPVVNGAKYVGGKGISSL